MFVLLKPRFSLLISLLILIFSGLLLSSCSTSKRWIPVENDSSVSKGDRFKRHHIVRKGETLYSIAWRANIDYHKLAAWNGVAGPEYRIIPGQRLRLKPPKYRLKLSKIPKKSKQPTEKVKSHTINKKKAVVLPKQLKLRWGWPTIGTVVRNYSKSDHRRQGIRIAGRDGQPITAAESGRVVYSGSGLIGYGNLVIIKHNDTYLSAYAHNRRIFVKEGMLVSKGTVISEMGIAPDSKKPALHFEIRRDGKPVDPQIFLPKRK